jgi:hypothetical protein
MATMKRFLVVRYGTWAESKWIVASSMKEAKELADRNEEKDGWDRESSCEESYVDGEEEIE